MSLRLPIFVASLLAVSLMPAHAATPSQPVLTDLYSQLQWRLVGPFRAGWSTMAEGVPSQPDTFYFGGADGGIWKSVDAGLTWTPQFQQAPSISIGALAVAPSNPNILYIGTGQPETRYDIVDGQGVYRSDDGGETWRSLGLTDTRHIGRIWVDPRNADVVLVAALGHIFGPNEERGVFRSEDGGKTWTKTLFVDGDTGAVDLAADPAAPDVIFASTWQAREWPWLSYYIPDQGPGSGIWKSVDGGKTWSRLTGNGLPGGSLGRIGIAVAPGTHDQRVYALVESAEEKDTGLYRSDDGGASWKDMGSSDLVSSYFDRITVDPKDPDTLYVMNRSVARSTDGGKTFSWFKGAPGGDDYHFMWINPGDNTHMVVASDQGTSVSVDGGKTWSPWYNQSTGQFYHVATDNRFPYHIYSGQQDSGTVETGSASDFGEITFRDWRSVGGDERSYVIPDTRDPDIVYVGGLGGRVSRFDGHTGQVQSITPSPLGGYAKRPTTVKYRYNWFYPLVSDPHKGSTLYLGAQVVFKTTDGGMHWNIISPDLSGSAKTQPSGCDGNKLSLHLAKDCGYGVIFSIAPSPVKEPVIWVGTDDGLVQLTRDGGKHWQDVTPKGMPFYGRVNQVEASPTDPATAYVAVDTHRQDMFHPYAFRTHDYGKTWQAITDGIPDDQFVYVVRQDLKSPRLLYAGTNAGVYVTFDDGDHWQPLQANLPNARVRDLTLHGDDLVAATHGRALWVLDDVTPLREVSDGLLKQEAHLFKPAEAVRLRRNENKDTPLPPEVPGAPNPPQGAILDYWLGAGVQGPVQLAIYDTKGNLVRRYVSDAAARKLDTEDQYFTDDWLSAPESLPAAPGAHRFVWDLRYPRPASLSYGYSIASVYQQGGALLPEGPLVLPGTYTVKFTAAGKTQTASLKVIQDPRMDTRDVKQALPKQLAFLNQIGAAMDRSYADHAAVSRLRDALKPLMADSDAAVSNAAIDLDAKAEQLESKAPKHGNFDNINGGFSTLATEAGDGDRAPPEQYLDSYGEYMGYLQSAEEAWSKLQAGELTRFNAMLHAKGRTAISVSVP